MFHVHPINDAEEHDLEGTVCKCGPSVVFEGAEIIVIHNSFDGREALEQAKEILNQ